MLLPAYDINGRLYYPQYEEAPSSRSIANLPDRARRATTRTKSPCIEDTFYSYALRKQEEALMGVKPRRPSLKVTSNIIPPSTAPIPKWTGKSDAEKRNRKSGRGDMERSCGRDIVGGVQKPKESALSHCHDVSSSLEHNHSHADIRCLSVKRNLSIYHRSAMHDSSSVAGSCYCIRLLCVHGYRHTGLHAWLRLSSSFDSTFLVQDGQAVLFQHQH